jgi:PKD repeat protein
LITSMSQSWGDGTSTTFNYINAAHTYSSPGTYVIRVTANESDGKTASASISVTVT